jgi:predicted dehydrogenase
MDPDNDAMKKTTMETLVQNSPAQPVAHVPLSRKPRLGFLGVGWIGRARLSAAVQSGLCEIVAVADPVPDSIEQATVLAPQAVRATTLEEILEFQLDGLVIATPSALHAEQSITALERGVAVFCQKPLARSGEETRRVIDAARARNRLLGVDLSYRHLKAARHMREKIRLGSLGKIFTAELVFHNAYGPDKPWFYNRNLSGGGCLMDLGIHLVDLALWMLDFPEVSRVEGQLFSGGKRLRSLEGVEDFARAGLETADGASVQLACSWKLHAGRDCVISATFYGTEGGARLRNVGGSFYEFRAEEFRGTRAEVLEQAPEPWGGRALLAWISRLAINEKFDASIENHSHVATIIDQIYAAHAS